MSISANNSALVLLAGIHGRIVGLREARSFYQARLASDYDPIELLRPWENDISRFIADLLSPRGKHGQGTIFLESFIQFLEVRASWANAGKAVVETEAITKGGRRIDIRITFGSPGSKPDGIIGIENKPWAGDQLNQVKDYIEELKSVAGESILFAYLSGSGEGPSRLSAGDFLDDKSYLKVIPYAELSEWLKLCSEMSQSPHVRFFIEAFSNYMYRKFKGVQDMGERKLVVEASIVSRDNIETAFAVAASIPDLKFRLFSMFVDQFRGKVINHHPEWIVESDFVDPANPKHKGVSIWLKKGASYRFRLAFENSSCSLCMLGVCKSSDEVQGKPELYDHISKFSGYFQKSPYWPWYKIVGPSNWDADCSEWLNMKGGELAEVVFADIESIYFGLCDVGQIEALCEVPQVLPER